MSGPVLIALARQFNFYKVKKPMEHFSSICYNYI